MGSPRAKLALEALGRDVRSARLRRGIAVADLAIRAGTSASSVTRLERGDPGVGIGTLAVERLTDLIDIRKDDLGLALTAERQPRRGRSFTAKPRKRGEQSVKASVDPDSVDPDGATF